MVNNAIRGLVVERYGEPAWRRVCAEAGTPESFEPLQPQPDTVTYGLVGSAVALHGIEASDFLHDLGRFWIERIARPHYGDLMSATGSSFVAFVRNLDSMHARIQVSFPEYRPPSFRAVPLADGRLQVDYYSEREGLLPLVEGLFAGLADHFGTPIAIEHVAAETHGMPCHRLLIAVDAPRP